MPEVSIDHLLIDLANVTRLDEIALGSGRFARDYVTVDAAIPFRCFTAGAKEMALAVQLRMNCTHTGYTQPDRDIAVSDVIVRTHREGVAITPEHYRVTGILDPSIAHHRKLVLERIQIGKEA